MWVVLVWMFLSSVILVVAERMALLEKALRLVMVAEVLACVGVSVTVLWQSMVLPARVLLPPRPGYSTMPAMINSVCDPQ